MQGQTKEELLDALSGKSAGIFEKGIKDIKANKDKVSFDECKLTDDMLRAVVATITKNSHIKEISFDNCDMTKGQASFLFKNITQNNLLNKLEKLSANNNDFGLEATSYLHDYIGTTPSLKDVSLASNNINDPCAMKILGAIKDSKIEKIDFKDNPISDATVADYIGLVSNRRSPLMVASFEHFFLSQQTYDRLNSAIKIKETYVKSVAQVKEAKNINVAQVSRRGR